MKFASQVTIDIETGHVEDRIEFEYSGPVDLCKGQAAASTQDASEMAMQKQAFTTQQAQLKQLQTSLQGYLSGTQGYTPQAMSGMTSQFLNSNNATYNQAGQQVREALGARGSGTGALPAGGDYTRGIAGLMGAKAGAQSQGLLGLNVQNQQQALGNQFNAANVLSGNAATQTGTQGVAGSAASSALGSYIQGSNAPGVLSGVAGLAGGMLGGTVPALINNAGKGCWIAEAVYGKTDFRVPIIRQYLNTYFRESWTGDVVMRTYLRFGQTIARYVKTRKSLRDLLRPLFDLAFRKALGV